MRFIHAADAHLGRLTHSRPGPDGIPTALASVARCWSAAIDVAMDRKVDAFLGAGDLFDKRNPSTATLNAFGDGVWRLSALGIPALFIPGNHDRDWPHSPLWLWRDRPNIIISEEPEILELAGLKVGTLPSIGRRNLAASGVAKRARAVDVAISEALERILGWYASENCDMVVGHWTVSGCVLGSSETDVSLVDEPQINPAWLEPFRYAALGHLHKQQGIGWAMDPERRIDELWAPTGAYSGSLDRMNFGEQDDPKGVLEVFLGSTELHAMRIDHHETPARRFVTLNINEPEPCNPEGAIVRIVGERQDGARTDLLADEMRRAGADLVLDQTKVDRPIVARDPTMAEAAGPMEQAARWLDRREVRPELREAVLARTQELIGR